MVDKKRLNESYDSKYRKIVNHIKKIMPKETRWSYDDYRVIGDDLGGGIRFQVEFDSKDSSLQKRIMDSIENYFYGVHCDTGWGRDWDYYISVNVDEKACNETFNKINKLTLNEVKYPEGDNIGYRLKFYTDTDGYNLDYEEGDWVSFDAAFNYALDEIKRFKKYGTDIELIEIVKIITDEYITDDGDEDDYMEEEELLRSIPYDHKKYGWKMMSHLPSESHTSYVIHQIMDWGRDYTNHDTFRSIKKIADACERYDDEYTADEYEFVIRNSGLLSKATKNSRYRWNESLDKINKLTLNEDLFEDFSSKRQKMMSLPEAGNIKKICEYKGWMKPVYVDKTVNGYRCNWNGTPFVKALGGIKEAEKVIDDIKAHLGIECQLTKQGNLIIPFSKMDESIKEGWESIDGLKFTRTGVHGEKLDDDWIDYGDYLVNKNRLQDEMLRDFKEESGYTRADENREEFWNEFDKFIAERGREYLNRAVNESLKEDVDDIAPIEPSDETPATPEANGVAKLILDAINDESDTIKMYNDLVANTDNEDIIKIIQDITAEENNHLGMLQRALEIVSPNASNIDDGMEEAESMIEEPVVNAEPDFVPVGESLNEEVSDTTLIGKVVANDGKELQKVLAKCGYSNVKHEGNYVFSAIKDGKVVYIDTKPLDDRNESEKIEIKSISESLNEDLHSKFKREIKNAYKQWAAQVEKVEQQRKEATYMIPDGADKEMVQKFINEHIPKIFPMPDDFKFEFPHNIEKDDFPFYVTYYAEYPIYEPAEGGYYYPGRDAIWSEGFETKEEAEQFLDNFIKEDGEDWVKNADGYILYGKYIGEDQMAVVEANNEYLMEVAGYEPYQ